MEFGQTLPMMLNRTLDRVMPVYRELFASNGLTDQQWRILRVLWTEGGVTSSVLAAQTLLPKPSLVGILDRLEQRGLIERVRSTSDRRSVTITSTSAGRQLAQEVLPKAEAIHAHFKSLISDREWDDMNDVLDKLMSKANATTLADILSQHQTKQGSDNG